jgi:hypothetical protein
VEAIDLMTLRVANAMLAFSPQEYPQPETYQQRASEASMPIEIVQNKFSKANIHRTCSLIFIKILLFVDGAF